jgi:hypothetical protein
MLDWTPLKDDENLISSEGREQLLGQIPYNRRIFELSASLRMTGGYLRSKYGESA